MSEENKEKNNQKNTDEETNKIVEEIKELVRKGNVSRILIKKDDTVILNVPMNVGVAGVFVGLVAAPWALLVTTIATIGFDCRVEVIKTDGETILVHGKENPTDKK